MKISMSMILSIVGFIIVILIIRAIINAHKKAKAEYNYKFYSSLRRHHKWETTENLQAQVKFNPDGPSNDARMYELQLRAVKDKMLGSGYTMEQVKAWDSIHNPFSMYTTAQGLSKRERKRRDMEKSRQGYRNKISQAKSDGRINSDGSINKSTEDDMSIPKWLKIAGAIVILFILVCTFSTC